MQAGCRPDVSRMSAGDNRGHPKAKPEENRLPGQNACPAGAGPTPGHAGLRGRPFRTKCSAGPTSHPLAPIRARGRRSIIWWWG